MYNIALNGREEKLVCKFEQFSGARIKLFTVVLFLAFVDSIKNEKAHEKKSTTRNKSAKSPGQRKQYELPWVGRLRSHSAGIIPQLVAGEPITRGLGDRAAETDAMSQWPGAHSAVSTFFRQKAAVST